MPINLAQLRFLWASKENEGAPVRDQPEKKYDRMGRATGHPTGLLQNNNLSDIPTMPPHTRDFACRLPVDLQHTCPAVDLYQLIFPPQDLSTGIAPTNISLQTRKQQ